MSRFIIELFFLHTRTTSRTPFSQFFLQNKKCVRKCSNKVVYSSTLFCCYNELFSFLLLNSMKGQRKVG